MENEMKGGENASRECPRCHSKRFWKDGIRKTRNGSVQRYVCRNCGYRFAESSVLSMNLSYSGRRQVCAILTEAKNLTEVEPLESGLAGATAITEPEIKGKILEYAWWMKKQGYKETTIETYVWALKNLVQQHADLREPETVKEALAKQAVSNTRKNVAIAAYTLFLKTQGETWEPPICKVTRKLPFIPMEQELDSLIAGCGKKTSTFLQLLKETAMRLTEASNLQWKDIDLQNRTITLNKPAKNGNPRMFRMSVKLINMLSALPKINKYVFGTNSKRTRQSVYYKQRRRLATKLGNPRLLRIGFHTFRHWKATMLYHETKDPMLVKEFLGHKSLDTTLL